MRTLHPLTRLAAVTALLLILMFCRSLTAAAAGLLGGLLCLLLHSGVRSFAKALGGCLCLAAVTAITDPLVSHRGMTVLLFVNSRAYTLESMLYGLQLGLSLGGVTIWLTLARRLLNDRELLSLFGRISPKLALTVSMTLGFIPRLIKKQRRIHEAQRGAGLFADNSPTTLMQEHSAVFGACIAWSAEAAADAARSMNGRGYGKHPSVRSDSRPLARRDMLLILAELCITAAAMVFTVLGGSTQFYPTLTFGRSEPHLTAACVCACLPPVITLAKETLQWKLYTSKH